MPIYPLYAVGCTTVSDPASTQFEGNAFIHDLIHTGDTLDVKNKSLWVSSLGFISALSLHKSSASSSSAYCNTAVDGVVAVPTTQLPHITKLDYLTLALCDNYSESLSSPFQLGQHLSTQRQASNPRVLVSNTLPPHHIHNQIMSLVDQQPEPSLGNVLVPDTPPPASSPQSENTDPIMHFDPQPGPSLGNVLVPDTQLPSSSSHIEHIDPIMCFGELEPEQSLEQALMPGTPISASSLYMEPTDPITSFNDKRLGRVPIELISDTPPPNPLTQVGTTTPDTDSQGAETLGIADEYGITKSIYAEDLESEFEDPDDARSNWIAFEEMFGFVEHNALLEEELRKQRVAENSEKCVSSSEHVELGEKVLRWPVNRLNTGKAELLDAHQELELRAKASMILKPDPFTTSEIESEEALHFLAALLTLSKEKRQNLLALSHKELGKTLDKVASRQSTKRPNITHMDSPERKRNRRI